VRHQEPATGDAGSLKLFLRAKRISHTRRLDTMKIFVVSLGVYLWFALVGGPGISAGETVDAVTQQAREARDKGDVQTLQNLISGVQEEVSRTNAFEANLRLALFDSWLCEAAHDRQNDKILKEAAQNGVAAAERAVKLNPESSEAHRLVGALLGELIPHVFAGGMRLGPRSTTEIEKAIQLDPRNSEAHVARAKAYFFTPQAFGGNKDKAIESLQKAIAIDPASDAAGTAHIWLASFYRSLGKTDSAISEISVALKMNPERLLAKTIQAQISAK
jgi:tetratricopeptide (TPR) repeat protein